MARKFNVGDRAKINLPGYPTHGVVVSITEIVRNQLRTDPDGVMRRHALMYVVDYEPLAACLARELTPIYDGGEPAKWTDCVWQPNQITVC